MWSRTWNVGLGAVVSGLIAYAAYDGYDRVAGRAQPAPGAAPGAASIAGNPLDATSTAAAPAPALTAASAPPAAPAPAPAPESAGALAELEAALRAGFQEDVEGTGRGGADPRATAAPEPSPALASASEPASASSTATPTAASARIPVRVMERGVAPPIAASVPARAVGTGPGRRSSSELELGCEVAAVESRAPARGAGGRPRFVDDLPPDVVARHEVVSGDTLSRIARAHGVTAGLIRRVNGLEGDRIRAGQRLAVPRGPFRVEVDRARCLLTVFKGDRPLVHYPVGIGRDGTTPTGDFKVLTKVENPEWQTPDGYYAADDPLNPLGERWIGIAPGYGIHGTVDPSSIGKAASRGCIRLASDDIEEVYDILAPGASVTIR